jgi:hypothetical protein
VTDGEMRTYVRRSIGSYKKLHSILSVPALLRGPSGKADPGWAHSIVNHPTDA